MKQTPTHQTSEPATTATRGVQPTLLQWHHWGPASLPSDRRRPLDHRSPHAPGGGFSKNRHAERGVYDLKGAAGSGEVLAGKTVFVAGLGAVGGRAFLQFARLGVGRLIGVDLDCYDAHSWLTQPVGAQDTGRSKSVVLGEQAHQINSQARISTASGPAEEVPYAVLRQADLFVVCGDNREVVKWTGESAAAFGKPLLQGAVHGESWTAVVRGWDLTEPEERPCPACSFSDYEWQTLRSREGCDLRTSAPDTPSVRGITPVPPVEPTRTLPNVCSLATDLLVGEALKFLLDVDAPRLAGEELTYSLLSHHVLRTAVSRNPECRLPHQRWRFIDVETPPSQLTLSMLVERLVERSIGDMERRSIPAAPSSRGDDLQVRGEQSWISFTRCGACRRSVPVRRFGQAGMPLSPCDCGEPLRASPIGLRSVIPSEDLRICAETPLRELGIVEVSAIGMSTGEEWTYFILGPAMGS